MHPILARLGRLGLYLLGWTPIAGVLVFLLAAPGQLTLTESALLAVPLCFIYAFVCLSAWYPSRIIPFRPGAIPTHTLAAMAASGLWVGLAKLVSDAVGLGNRFAGAMPALFGMGVVLYLLAVTLHYVLIALAASREAQKRETEARVLAGEAELKALKAQINPHFLFNSLHSISALTTVDAAKARDMCVLLSGFLRSTLGMGDKAAIPFEEELSLARNYLAIEKVRFGARMEVVEDVAAECRSFPVPPLLLQPLIENAVIHGIAHLVENGQVHIVARRDERGLRLMVENNFDPEAPKSRRNGFGLEIVRKRLNARYGDRAWVRAGPVGDNYRVALWLPGGEAGWKKSTPSS